MFNILGILKRNSFFCWVFNKKMFFVKILIILICFPFFLCVGIYGILLYKKILKSDTRRKFKYFFSIVAIAKDEGPYLDEWIEYHRLIGVEHVFLFNNDSMDNTLKILQKYEKENFVTIINIKGKCKQNVAYNTALNLYYSQSKYIAFIDIDEFIVLKNNNNVRNVLDKHFENCLTASLMVNWQIYGSNGYKQKPDGLVIEKYTMRAKEDWKKNLHCKSILNPRRVLYFTNPHFCHPMKGKNNYSSHFSVVEGAFLNNVETDIILLNHYFCKSYDEFVCKRNRGKADQKGIRDFNEFLEHDMNEVLDLTLEPYVNAVKLRMNY